MISHGTTGPGNLSNPPDFEAAQVAINAVMVPCMGLSARVTGTGTTQPVWLLVAKPGDREDPAAGCAFARSRSFVQSSEVSSIEAAHENLLFSADPHPLRRAAAPLRTLRIAVLQKNKFGMKGVRMQINRREQGNAIVRETNIWTPVESLRADAQHQNDHHGRCV